MEMKKLILPAALLLSLTGFAQSTPTKLNFPKGQKLELVTEMKKATNIEVMGQSMETNITSTMTEHFDIENADASGATIEHKVKRLVLNSTGGMGGDMSFDSEKESDMKGDMGKMLEKGLKNKYTMNVDAMGKVTAVKLDDDNPNAKKDEQAEAMAAMMSQQMGVNFGVPEVGSTIIMKVLPNREVKAAETWVDTSSKNGRKSTINYKVNSITATDVVLDYTQTVETNTTQQIMGQEATIKSSEKAAGQITVDKATGLLKQKTATVETSGTISAQGMDIPVTDKTTLTITVKSGS
jgi:hypothetical protein